MCIYEYKYSFICTDLSLIGKGVGALSFQNERTRVTTAGGSMLPAALLLTVEEPQPNGSNRLWE